jgi:uncharacterized membrane protein YqjE
MDTVAHMETVATTNGRARSLSTRDLIAEILSKATTLAKKEVELAKTEIKADLRSQIAMAQSLAIAAVLALLALNALLVALVVALAAYMPAWLAALVIAAVLFLAAGILGWVGWKRRLTSPLAVTRKRLKEDAQWAKERLA